MTPPRDSDHRFHGDWEAINEALNELRVEVYRAQRPVRMIEVEPCASAIGVHRPWCECGAAAVPEVEEKK